RELENVLRAAVLFAEGPVITVADLVDNFASLRALARSAPFAALLPSPPSSGPEAATSSEPEATPSSASTALVAYSRIRAEGVSLGSLKREIERECIARALDETNGNITHAAALLGMKRPRLSQLAKEYNLKATPEDE
ncbi:MAG: Nitrogenase (molybdenum-iron)-specific transcriptional regulator NifA, partial [Labilithrix sp.]|nr:Nitrogenase (molybdenum-iron)-specific transcriptional regulator NifA [Labilithrix sp.]